MLQPTSSTVREGLEGPETRARLLDAAEELFAERGYHAASVRDITSAAGSNLAAVNYHFGGKAELYRAVFVRRLAALRDRRGRAIEEATRKRGRSRAQVLRGLAVAYLEPLVDGTSARRWARLSLRELLDPQLSPDLFFDEMVEPTHDALAAALVKACPGLDPDLARVCVESLIGQLNQLRLLHGYFAAAPEAKAAQRFDLMRAVDQAASFSAAALRELARHPSGHPA